MPLVHGKSDKAFSQNVRTEMHHGKSQPQSLAIAYAVKKKAQHKMAEGGPCEPHGLDMCQECSPHYADGGGVKGVHPAKMSASHKGGTSYAGAHLQEHQDDDDSMSQGEKAKGEHQLVMHELKKMGGHDRKYLAEGGAVDPRKSALIEGLKTAFGGPEDSAYGATEQPHEKKVDPNPLSESMKKSFKTPGFAMGGDIVGHIMKKHYSQGGVVANEDHEMADFEPNQFDDLVLDDSLEEHYTGANSGDELGNEQEDHDRKDIVHSIMKSRKKKDRLPHPA